jgi:3-isopropylmalate dehydrogenase
VVKTGYAIALLPGDGIGVEVTDAAALVLDAAASASGVRLAYERFEVGAHLYQRTGDAIPDEVMQAVGRVDATLFGAAGLPHVRKPDGTELTPQIDIREHYGLFASVRPARLFRGVPSRVRADAVDMVIVRECTEGAFAGRHDDVALSNDSVSDRITATRSACERVFELSFELARQRRARAGTAGSVTLLDKANVLRSSAFMRRIFDEVAGRYPDVETARLYIDAGAMMLVTDPARFDVIVTENVFGDITSEVAAGVVGGLGVVPSADVGREHAVFQPCHGSAPELAGQNLANPVAAILSAAMLVEWLGERHDDDACHETARLIRTAVQRVLGTGPRTPDIGGSSNASTVTAAIVDTVVSAELR